jgi:AcrR family transcriptional regulator
MDPTDLKVFRKETDSVSETSAIDGRLHRSIKTRGKIVSAFIHLIGQGNPSPTAEQIASEAKVGLRTVFRHFEDMETLYREITQRLDELMMPLVHKPLQATDWRDRLMESIERRCDIFDHIAPFHTAAQLHMHESKHILQQVQRRVKIEQDILARLLPANLLSNQVFFESLSMMVSLETWMRLRSLQRLSTAKSKTIVMKVVQSMLSTHAPLP